MVDGSVGRSTVLVNWSRFPNPPPPAIRTPNQPKQKKNATHTGSAKDLIDQDLVNALASLLLGSRDQNTLSSSKTRGLKDNIKVVLLDKLLGLGGIGEVLVGSSGDVVLLHKVLGERLRALHAGGLDGGSEHGDSDWLTKVKGKVGKKESRKRLVRGC